MLALKEWIAQSDDELEIWASVTVGFDDDKNFVVRFEFIDYEEEENNYEVRALIGFQEAYELAERLNVKLTALPSAIKKHCGNCSVTLRPSQVNACFKEVLDYIVSCGGRYKLNR